MTIGEKIKLYRKKSNLTQEELADKTNLTRVYIANLEKDKKIPSISVLYNIAQVLDTTIDGFFLDESSSKTPQEKQLLNKLKEYSIDTPEVLDFALNDWKVLKNTIGENFIIEAIKFAAKNFKSKKT